MQFIPRLQAERYQNGSVVSWEYAMKSARLNVAPISINGRYPIEGFTSNTVSDSVVHVTQGSGFLYLIDGTELRLSQNDQVHIAPNDIYYFEGNLEIIYAASPSWSFEQTQQIMKP